MARGSVIWRSAGRGCGARMISYRRCALLRVRYRSMRPVPPATRLLTLIALLLLAAHAWAARAVRVYEVDLTERSGTALQQAMREARVRATGRREAAEDPALARIVAEAAGYVKGYTTGPRGESQVIFDG